MTEYRLHGVPGAGKTHTLSNVWVPRACDRVGARKVAICSLTKTAAIEVAGRLVDVLPRENIGTLHSFCLRAITDPNEKAEVASSHITEWNKFAPAGYQLKSEDGKKIDDDPFAMLGSDRRTRSGSELMQRVESNRHNMKPLEEWGDRTRAFYEKWREWRDGNNFVDFTQMIERALDETLTPPGMPEVLIVDEAQDSSKLELELVRKWGQTTEFIVLAGDSDQSIYEWRGASARAFLTPEIPEKNNFKLEQSYRVPRKVAEYVNKWIDRVSYRFPLAIKPRDFEGHVGRLRANTTRTSKLIGSIKEKLADGKSCMILATCGFLLDGVIKDLRREGIPFANPYKRDHGKWNPLRSAHRVSNFLLPCRDARGTDVKPWTHFTLYDWVDMLRARGKDAILTHGEKSRLKMAVRNKTLRHAKVTDSMISALFRPEHLRELVRVLGDGTTAEALAWLRAGILPGHEYKIEYPSAIVERYGVTALDDEPRVIVGTIHSVKGGEADCVYVSPNFSPAGYKQWHDRRKGGRDAMLRLFYVALTRAREEVHLLDRAPGQSFEWSQVVPI